MTANSSHQALSSFQVIDAFKSALIKELAAAPATIEPGPILRFDDPKGKRGNLACFCQLFSDGHPAGYFGNWRTGFYQTWVYGGVSSMTSAERQRFSIQIARAKQQREKERAERQQQAQEKALYLWEQASTAKPEHPYLMKKQVSPHNLRQLGTVLLVPLYVNAQLANLQRIYPNGDKRFLSGGRITGAYSVIGSHPNTERVYMCEGWATGATIYQQTQCPVLCAMNAGNLKPVAAQLRAAMPDSRIIIAGDDDRETEGNPGATKAIEAAQHIGGEVIFPQWPPDAPASLTDFNDLAIYLMGNTYG